MLVEERSKKILLVITLPHDCQVQVFLIMPDRRIGRISFNEMHS